MSFFPKITNNNNNNIESVPNKYKELSLEKLLETNDNLDKNLAIKIAKLKEDYEKELNFLKELK
jgi:hypothetical protein